MFTLHEVCSAPYADRPLRDDDRPLYVQNSWPKDKKEKYSLVLRRLITQGLVEGRVSYIILKIITCHIASELTFYLNETCMNTYMY